VVVVTDATAAADVTGDCAVITGKVSMDSSPPPHAARDTAATEATMKERRTFEGTDIMYRMVGQTCRSLT